MLTQSANSQPNNQNNNNNNAAAKNDSYVNAYVPPQTVDQQKPQQQSRSQPQSQQQPQKQSKPFSTTDGKIAGGKATPPFISTSASPAKPNFASGNTLPSPVANNTKISNVKADQDKAQSEIIEDQNIFQLLGVNDGTDEEKERFLDELQEVIWEDFLETDLELLVTEEEHAKVKEILAQTNKNDQERQDETIQFLEKLIPDLEEIMLEKALELKEDMVRERIAGMREFYAGNAVALSQLDEAEKLIAVDKWYSAAQKLNGVG